MVLQMKFIDPRSYYQREMWQRQGKSIKWLNGYEAGFNAQSLPHTASADYKEGYQFGLKDNHRENIPPMIKNGFSFGHGYISNED